MHIKIGATIKNLRTEHHITQETLANALGVTPQAISRWEATAGGSALRGEDALTCVRRELYEETGVQCDTFVEIGRTIDRESASLFVTYACEVDCDKSCVRLQEGETESYMWLDESEFVALLRSGKMIACQIERYAPLYCRLGWL